jgi:hypothetical protein
MAAFRARFGKCREQLENYTIAFHSGAIGAR